MCGSFVDLTSGCNAAHNIYDIKPSQKTSTFSRAGGLILLVIISTFIAMMNTSSQFSSLASLLIIFFGTYIFINRKLDYSIQSISSENQSNSNKRFRISA